MQLLPVWQFCLIVPLIAIHFEDIYNTWFLFFSFKKYIL